MSARYIIRAVGYDRCESIYKKHICDNVLVRARQNAIKRGSSMVCKKIHIARESETMDLRPIDI